jgi:hypothetical protein
MSRYFFRLDMAKDNEEFFVARHRSGADCVYSGIAMRVGPGWIPDCIEVNLDTKAGVVKLIILELEATDIVARASCRKYLPEPSSAVLQAFAAYLDAVVSQCRSTADPRLALLEDLQRAVATHPHVLIHTAGALRLTLIRFGGQVNYAV